MRRVLSHLFAGAVGAIVVTKELERRGVLCCGCSEACWCHRSGLSALRWTLPIGHAPAAYYDPDLTGSNNAP